MENFHTQLRRRRARRRAAKATAITVAIATIAAATWTILETRFAEVAQDTTTPVAAATTTTETPRMAPLTHAERTWISALEWCESRGNKSAINPKDRDGTPSYGAFQFKPETLKWYGEKYDLIATNTPITREIIMDRDLQLAILERMLRDKHVRWEQQFPDCVTRKIGRPPQPPESDPNNRETSG
jgi:hypothetical protein